MDTSSIVILDFGSQYTQLIARRIREQNVFSVVLPCTASVAEIRSHHPIGLILSGGPCSVYDSDAPAADPEMLMMMSSFPIGRFASFAGPDFDPTQIERLIEAVNAGR